MHYYLSSLIENEYFPLLLISLLHFSAWAYCLTLKGWVSDDIEGIAKFSDRYIIEKDGNGNVVRESKIESYDVDLSDNKKRTYKHCDWNNTLGFPSNMMRWFRLNWGKEFKEIGKTAKGHQVYGWVQSAPRHHLLNILFQWMNLILGYNFIAHFFGPQIAFISMLIFALHPCNVQTVGWISGINYVFSLFGTLVILNSVIYITNPYILYPVLAIASIFSCITLLPGCFNFVPLLLLGFNRPALVVGLIGLYIMLRLGKWSVDYRRKAFKEQAMGRSTSINFRKPIVMVKTFWYYLKLVLFPKRLGLFHTWGYHYEETIEYVDHTFWKGLASIIAYIALIIVYPFAVKFGLIFAFFYMAIFSNIITAQQFVSERYLYMALFGLSIALAHLFVCHPVILSFILGIFIMRIWVHLPTFQNEVRFYESNIWNFPDSEVAMGNLGVAYINHGMRYKAYDSWQEASRQNDLYDVPWYNLYSIAKQNGDILGAKHFLEKCLDAKTVHFKDVWKREMSDLENIVRSNVSIEQLTRILNKSIKEAGYGSSGTV